MRDLQEYAEKCMKMLDAIDIPYGNVVSFEINTRAKKRWGQAKKVPNGYSININVDLLDERNSEECLINTIIHELIHTCKGCMNHGDKWKMYARKVKMTYGYNIKRCSDSEEKGITFQRESKELPYKYIVKCPKCGYEWKRKRETHVVRFPNFHTCGKCGVQLVRVQ